MSAMNCSATIWRQQSCLTLHRTRHLFIRQQTAVINSIRAYLAEFGIVAPVGRNGVEQLLEVVADANDTRLPEIARACVAALGTQLLSLKAQILAFDRRIMAWHRSNETSMRLDAIPGVGPALATALVASVADGRDFSAWIGLVPKQNSSGGKTSLAVSANRAIIICAACSRPAHELHRESGAAIPRASASQLTRRSWAWSAGWRNMHADFRS
jgi:transposase